MLPIGCIKLSVLSNGQCPYSGNITVISICQQTGFCWSMIFQRKRERESKTAKPRCWPGNYIVRSSYLFQVKQNAAGSLTCASNAVICSVCLCGDRRACRLKQCPALGSVISQANWARPMNFCSELSTIALICFGEMHFVNLNENCDSPNCEAAVRLCVCVNSR